MQKKLVLTIIITSFFLFSLLSVPSNAADIPGGLPHQIYGFVFDEEGDLIPNGNVTAELNDKTFTTTINNGKYGFQAETEAFLIQGDSGDAGDTIYFYINDTKTSESAIFQAGGINDDYSTYMNLSFDTTPPVITSVSVSSIGSSQATISWITNEKSDSIVNYGVSVQLGDVKQDSSYVKNHEIIITNLEPDTIYYFEAVSYDISGNIATDDNSSNYYNFRTDIADQNGDDDDGGNGGVNPGGNGFIPAPPPSDENKENIIPVANAGGPYYSKINQPVTFDASDSSDPDGYIIEYIWGFGDGTNITTNNLLITHTYLLAGQYIVTLKVVDNNGTSNSAETQVNITSDDFDNDGWSDSSEEYYGTNASDPNDYPVDSDNDKVPDDWDSDDDNDGLTDLEEETIGTNTNDRNDVLRILNEFGLFYLVDTDADGVFDKYYNQAAEHLTDLKIEGNFSLIDINNNNKYEYKYDKISGEISKYNLISENSETDNSLIIIAIGIVVLIILVICIKWRKKIS